MNITKDELQHYPIDLDALPPSWCAAHVQDIARKIQPGFPSGKHNKEGRGVPHLRPMNISRDGVLDLAEIKYVEDTDGIRLKDSDVLFNNTNSPALVGKTAAVIGAGDWAFSNHMTRVAPCPGVSTKYLAHHLHYLWLSGYFRHRCINHVNQASISSGPLGTTVPLAIAPSAEQERIVAAIEEQFSRLDAGVVALERVRRNLARMRAAVLTQAIQGWSESPLGSIGKVYVGTTPSRARQEFWGGIIPWVSSGEVAFCRIRKTRETITERALGSPLRLHPPGTVLLAMIGEGKTRGQAAILDVPAAHNQNSAAIRLDKHCCLPEWLFYVLMARYEETRHASSGGNQPALSGSRVKEISVPLPPIDQQQSIVRDLEQQLSLLDVLGAEVDRLVPRSAILRASILGRAFTGKLVAQEPNDEPASVLLEGIAAQRTSSKGHKPIEARRRRYTKATA